MVFANPELLILLRRVERVEVIGIFISISSTLAEFTCSISSAKVSKLTCHLSRKQIIGALSQEIKKEGPQS